MPIQKITSGIIQDGAVAAADIVSVANTAISGLITASQIAAVNGSVITANTIANSAIQTGAVENYMSAAGLGFGMRNRIINGAMVIDQRNAGASVTPINSQYLVDRWQASLNAASKFTVQQNAGSVTPPTGFSNYLGCTSSSAYSVPASETYAVRQMVEGFNFADMAWGTASAKTVTLSFWVYSSLTGTFGGALQNSAYTRSYPFSFTISSANTWTQISVTIAGDTTGTWIGATNGAGVRVVFSLGTGSTYSGTANAWAGTEYWSVTGATSVVGTNGATFYITGVQLEKGSTATSFDYRPYGTEFNLCLRYFYLSNPSNTAKNGGAWGSMSASTTGHITGALPVPMRTAPTYTFGGTSNTYYISNVTATSSGTPVNSSASPLIVDYEINSMSTGAVGYPIQYNGQLSITAEL